MKPLRLYVHIPYCRRRCPYCDFNTYAHPDPDWDALFAALAAEMRLLAGRFGLAGRRLASVFFGGGTPSLAPPGKIAALIEQAAALFGLEARAEITLEANPESAAPERLRELRAAGVNRLSVGVQSLSARGLAALGRTHGVAEAVAALEAARRAGFANLSLDLICGWPGQTPADWARDLERAVALAPEHLSCYELTIEPGTPFARRGVRGPDEARALAMWRHARAFLAAHGYESYEVSNHARPGMRARHNEGYWRYDDYLGLGPGAAGKLDMEDGGALRWTNERSPERYMARVRSGERPCRHEERLDRRQAAREALWLGLRRRAGVAAAPFARRFGVRPAALVRRHAAARLAEGLLRTDAAGGVRASEKGLLLLDAIAADLLG